MEEALIILKEIQNKLINRNNNDDQKIGLDINKVIKIISEHKCISKNTEEIKLDETIKEIKEENNKMNMNNKDMKIEIEKLNCLFKEYKEELQKFKNEININQILKKIQKLNKNKLNKHLFMK